MNQKYEALFTPWKIGNVEIKNRIVLCPMGGTSLFGWMEHTGNHFDKKPQSFLLKRLTTMSVLLYRVLRLFAVPLWVNGYIKTKKCLLSLKTL